MINTNYTIMQSTYIKPPQKPITPKDIENKKPLNQGISKSENGSYIKK